MTNFDGNRLRRAFTQFFTERGHSALPPAGLIPHDPSVLFTIAGMVQFKPYFTGESVSPVPRATTVQPCFRTVDIDIVGSTARHGTFFEMLGNFSFGDYFKDLAIPYAYELVTETLGLDPERLWVTVHDSDEDATGIWLDVSAVPIERIQKMGEDNFWRMGDVGPCGPCSELYYDRGPQFGSDGGPAHGGSDRFVEIWNLVFMQYEQSSDGQMSELPRKSIDTGAGLERLLVVLNEKSSLFETDVVAPILDVAASLTNTAPGSSERGDVALRILADHARAMTFLVTDGVFPSNDGRGYVLRRVIRRAALRAHQLGVRDLVMPTLCSAVAELMSESYPKIEASRSLVETVVAHEEEAFRRTLRQGAALIEEALESGGKEMEGAVAFRLHDTFGFPIDLTVELAAERGVTVDRTGFDAEMELQRDRARQAIGERGANQVSTEIWKQVVEAFGSTSFVGYRTLECDATVLCVVPRDELEFESYEGERAPVGVELFDLCLNVTPFYAEGGGQVGDTGLINSASGRFRVLDTTVAVEGLERHTGYFVEGSFDDGERVLASVDADRRAATRRNHTATHLLQSALRRVLGEHVAQQGSLVAPDRLRFDFSHFSALTDEEIAEVERIVNAEVLTDEEVRTYETTHDEAVGHGAIAFFDEKYGDVVRVVEAGGDSVELCGGTHVSATGMIGAFKIVTESSIGSNTRRIEATTGEGSLELFRREGAALRRVAEVLRSPEDEVVEAAGRVIERQRQLEEELRALRSGQLRDEARLLAAQATDGRVVARRDNLDPNELRELALTLRAIDGVDAVGLIGSPDAARVALVVASLPDAGLDAKAVASEVARLVGGGGGGTPELATAGGRDVSGIDAALSRLSDLLVPTRG